MSSTVCICNTNYNITFVYLYNKNLKLSPHKLVFTIIDANVQHKHYLRAYI